MKVKNITKKYGKTIVLNNVIFEINKGGVCALIGLNGSGKSTLMIIICSLTIPNDRTIEFDGNNYVCYMIESPSFYDDLSGYKNIKLLSKLFDNITDEKINEVLKLVDWQSIKISFIRNIH